MAAALMVGGLGPAVRLYVYDKGVAKDYLTVEVVRHGCSWWWTRSQPQAEGGTASRAAFVGPRGDVKTCGRVDLDRYGVRPAVRLSPGAGGAAGGAAGGGGIGEGLDGPAGGAG